MRKQIILFFGLILYLNSYSQITFEKGYFINNSGEKIDCLIKNLDWDNSPNRIEYKLSESSEEDILNLESVKEFGLYNNISKYISINVNIDRSSDNLRDLSDSKNPVFNKEQLFLKVLVEGKASLYSYKNWDLVRFFFSTDSLEFEQLIYKKYNVSQNTVGKNNSFRQQLFSELKCENITLKKIKSLDYDQSNLLNIFTKYNECANSEFVQYGEKIEKGDLFNLSIRPGINSSSLSVYNISGTSFADADFDNKLSMRLGFEAEFIMPFNRNKWAVIIEPTFQYYKSEKDLPFNLVAYADYKSIQIPIGLRHYFFLNNNSKIFINASYFFDFPLNSAITYDGYENTFKFKVNNGLVTGLGYKYKDNYSFEFRYNPSRNIIDGFFWVSEYKSISLIFGYTIF